MNNNIFFKKQNKNSNIYFFNKNNNLYDVKIKNFPSLYKEWSNFIFNYNKNNSIDNTIYNNFIIKLTESYFSLRKLNTNKLNFNKIFISKPYIKFNNSKIVITLFIFNREKFSRLKILLLRINKISKIFKYTFINPYYYNIFKKELKKLRLILIKLYTNKLKFQKNLLNILSNKITSFYNKKIEFNIINLKNFKYNSNILTNILSLKIKNRKTNIMNLYRSILANTIKDNNTKNINSLKLLNFLFDKISYKNLKGISLLSKGRLTKRYKADRSVKLYNLIGGLNNTNYNNRYKTLYRNNINSNIEFSKYIDKRRIGAFAIKGWISGKY
jgi:ribosomal VAR1-like protein